MSDKAEDFAKQLIIKTEAGKVHWYLVAVTPGDSSWTDAESYRTDLLEGLSFSIRRKVRGDDQALAFELTHSDRIVLIAYADNLPPSLMARNIVEQRRTNLIKPEGALPIKPIDETWSGRFQLFSDLFYAARKSALARDQVIKGAQQLLESLA